MPRIAVFGGTGYLASIIKSQNKIKNNRYIFFSRNKKTKYSISNFLQNKNNNNFKYFDIIIHLAGPNQNQLKKNKNLLIKKNQITSKICEICLTNNIKLLYISSMQVYKDYGKNNISINSKINYKNLYSKLHYESEKIILSKFINHRKMFTILRMGNVFGFKNFKNQRDIKSNLVHSLCDMALNRKKILIQNGSITRTFIPSQIFFKIINLVIKKNFFENSIINIFYKNLNLYDIAQIIKKRFKLIFDSNIDVFINKFPYKKNFSISTNKKFKFKQSNQKIYFEIDRILRSIKKLKKKSNFEKNIDEFSKY